MVITVPGYLTQHERKAMMNSIQIAKKKIPNDYQIQLIS